MFELNKNLEVKEDFLLGSKIYTVDNFYKDPEEVSDYLFNREVPLWKLEERPSYNSVYFNDRRLIQTDFRLYDVYNFLSGLCGMSYDLPTIFTNITRFSNNDFNDYENCFWWPHLDNGYNGIVYFSDECGTCLYEDLGVDGDTVEHREPWRPKDNYKVLETLVPKYNRMVLFDGMIPHGMNICSDRYFGEEYRKNQVFFFDKDEVNF